MLRMLVRLRRSTVVRSVHHQWSSLFRRQTNKLSTWSNG